MQQSKLLITVLAAVAVMSSSLPPASADDGDATATSTPTFAPGMVWRNPVGRPRFALLCIHGLGLYSKSYDDFARRITKLGAVVYAIDVRGFGQWMQAQGKDDNKLDFDGCLNDIKTALQAIRQAQPRLPVYLLGESMGGAIALRATSMYPELIDGLISSVPAAERFKSKRTDLKVGLQLLRGPNRQFDIGKQVVDQAVTAERKEDGKTVAIVNEQLQQDWSNDPLDRMELSPKELMQFDNFMKDNDDAVKKITSTPVLFMQGLDDRLVKPEGTWDLAMKIQTADRMLIALPSRHLIFEEAQTQDPRVKRASTQLVVAWIMGHMPWKDGGDPALYGSANSPLNAAPADQLPTIVRPIPVGTDYSTFGGAQRPPIGNQQVLLPKRRAKLRRIGK